MQARPEGEWKIYFSFGARGTRLNEQDHIHATVGSLLQAPQGGVRGERMYCMDIHALEMKGAELQ